MQDGYPFDTLPDILGDNLDLVLVGINPSSYSVARGHYFARPQNRFWPAFSLSRLSQAMRAGLGVDSLRPEHDVRLPDFGMGLTDVVKTHSPNASTLTPDDYRKWTPHLAERLSGCRPRVACFHGMVGFRPFVRYGLGQSDVGLTLGLQPFDLEGIPLFVLPNPSPANAQYRLADLVAWYERLADYLDGFERGSGAMR